MSEHDKTYRLQTQDEQRFIVAEFEELPNKFSAQAMLIAGIIAVAVWILNELGIFHCRAVPMRVGMVIFLICVAIIQILVRTKLVKDHRTKYVIIVTAFLAILFLNIMLPVHATLSLVLPALIGVQYHRRFIAQISHVSCMAIAFASPLIGYLLGTWDVNMLSWMLSVFSSSPYNPPAAIPGTDGMDAAKVILYLSLPQTLITATFGPFMLSSSKMGFDSIQSRAQLMHMGLVDSVTECFNRNVYDARLTQYSTAASEVLTCIYMDANGLHELNNAKGHDAGDELLATTARCLKEQFGEEDVYRIGGDEFVTFAVDVDEEEVAARVKHIIECMDASDYSVSTGIASEKMPVHLHELVLTAEDRMYAAKRAYYAAGPNNRRAR